MPARRTALVYWPNNSSENSLPLNRGSLSVSYSVLFHPTAARSGCRGYRYCHIVRASAPAQSKRPQSE